MNAVAFPKPVKLFVGLISNEPALMEKTDLLLKKRFGQTDVESSIWDFNFTSYYNKEMGDNLKRKFLSFKKLVRMEGLNMTKRLTNRLEKRFSESGRRRINIDPGYICLSKLVLFTTKDYYHRIYLGKGIYSEVTLYYKGDTFLPFEWSYPDYKSKDYIDFFNAVRGLYFSQLKE